MAKQLIGLDIETYDPLLKDAGWSWKYGEGYILNTALYYAESDAVSVIAGKYNENSPYSKDERAMMNKISIESILKNPNVCIVGANLQYDIGWLLYEYSMSTYDVKCSFIDVLIAEHLLDEFNIHTLDELSWKYLKYGKTKDRIETWVRENVSAKGDFRKYLKDAPWDLLCEYVTGDAKNPVNIWKKQLTLLKEQDLCSRTKLEFDCLLPILQITMNGYPIDAKQKEKNKKELEECISLLEKEFRSKYDMPTFRVTASNDIASFCDKRNIPYRCKITLKGYNGELLGEDYVKIDSAYNRAKKIVSSFQYVKSKPVAYVPKEMAERTCDLLSEEGFTYTCSPNVDKKFFASAREEYPEIGLIADWKLAKGILSKILGEKYDRFIHQDKDGVYKVHPQFKTTDTISMRLSSVMPNGQQIPSKGGFTITVDGKEKEVSFPALTRALFKPSSDKILWKIDYGQIEYRLICNIAVGEGSKEVREEFKRNPKLDFHQYVVDLTGLSRKYAKNMSFGISFGMGLKSMSESFGWTMEKAEEISEQYNAHMPFVQPTLVLVGDVAKKRGYIRTVCGSHARLPNPNKSYTMLNRYTQGSGAEILKSSIVRAYKEGLWEKIHVVNTIHDELNGIISVSEDNVRSIYEMAKIMTTTVLLNVPLEAEPEFGLNWAETKTVNDWLKIKNSSKEEWEQLPLNLRQAIEIADKIRGEYE